MAEWGDAAAIVAGFLVWGDPSLVARIASE